METQTPKNKNNYFGSHLEAVKKVLDFCTLLFFELFDNQIILKSLKIKSAQSCVKI